MAVRKYIPGRRRFTENVCLARFMCMWCRGRMLRILRRNKDKKTACMISIGQIVRYLHRGHSSVPCRVCLFNRSSLLLSCVRHCCRRIAYSSSSFSPLMNSDQALGPRPEPKQTVLAKHRPELETNGSARASSWIQNKRLGPSLALNPTRGSNPVA